MFDTHNGYGVAGQTVDHDRQTDAWQQVVPPTQMRDGFATQMQALAWMRERASDKLAQLTQTFQGQGETVLVASVEVGPWQ